MHSTKTARGLLSNSALSLSRSLEFSPPPPPRHSRDRLRDDEARDPEVLSYLRRENDYARAVLAGYQQVCVYVYVYRMRGGSWELRVWNGHAPAERAAMPDATMPAGVRGGPRGLRCPAHAPTPLASTCPYAHTHITV